MNSEELNQQVVAAHNPQLIETAEYVFLLMSNGELMKRKGGKVYCSPHNGVVLEQAFISNTKGGFQFVEEGDGFTYAILTREEAYAFREKMIEVADSVLKRLVPEINERIVAAHNAHYDDEHPTGLIYAKSHVFHLYNDGEITMEKGGDLYGNRTRQTYASGCRAIISKGFKFPLSNTRGDESYAILTQEECIAFRKEMLALC